MHVIINSIMTFTEKTHYFQAEQYIEEVDKICIPSLVQCILLLGQY